MKIKTPIEKIKDYIENPKELKRDLEDIKDAAGDIVKNKSSREVTIKEVKKAVNRKIEDVKDNWKNIF